MKTKKNPLLTNMINKVGILDGAISHCYTILNNKPIELNGLHPLKFVRGENVSDEDVMVTIEKFELEREALVRRIINMGGSL